MRYRRDVPDVVVDQLVRHFRLGGADRVLDLGAGSAQLLLPLSRRVGLGVGLDPEPDMLRLLRDRAKTGRARHLSPCWPPTRTSLPFAGWLVTAASAW